MQSAHVVAPTRTLAGPVATAEICTVALLVAAGTVSNQALRYAVAVAILFWPIRWLTTGRLSVPTPGDWPVGVLLVMLPVTVWATALPDVTWPVVWRLALGIALYYAIVNWARTFGRLRALGFALAGLGLLLALSAPVTVQWFGSVKLLFIPEAIYRRLPLLLADPIHPNVMAGALVLLLPLVLAPLLFDWRGLRWSERLFLGVAGVLMAGVLVLTKSRGGLLGFGAAQVVMVALRWRRGWLAIPGVAAAAALGAWQLGLSRVLEALSAAQAIGGLDGRLEVWSRAIFMTQDFPFTGIGMGTFRQVANAMYPFFLAGPDANVPHADNLFLQVAVDLGLPGLVAWLALFGMVCLAAWRAYRWGRADAGGDKPQGGDKPPGGDKPRPYMAALGAGLLCSQVALSVHGLLDAPTWGTRTAVVVWAVWGLGMATCNWQTDCHKTEAPEPVELGQVANRINDTGAPEESWS